MIWACHHKREYNFKHTWNTKPTWKDGKRWQLIMRSQVRILGISSIFGGKSFQIFLRILFFFQNSIPSIFSYLKLTFSLTSLHVLFINVTSSSYHSELKIQVDIRRYLDHMVQHILIEKSCEMFLECQNLKGGLIRSGMVNHDSGGPGSNSYRYYETYRHIRCDRRNLSNITMAS